MLASGVAWPSLPSTFFKSAAGSVVIACSALGIAVLAFAVDWLGWPARFSVALFLPAVAGACWPSSLVITASLGVGCSAVVACAGAWSDRPAASVVVVSSGFVLSALPFC